MNIQLQSIGFVRSTRIEPVDDQWNSETSVIELDETQFTPDSLAGLETYSHVEVVYWFHHDAAATATTGARHPRGRKDWPLVGIFAQRGKNRPNRIGLTICKVVKVDGLNLEITGLDAIDGTPVLDLKPWMAGFAPQGETREPDWAREIMTDYW